MKNPTLLIDKKKNQAMLTKKFNCINKNKCFKELFLVTDTTICCKQVT